MSFCTTSSLNLRPIKRLTAYRVLCGLVTAWRLALCPTSTSSSLVNATIDGVVRSPSAFSIILGLPPSSMATHELVVPKSMPIILLMSQSPKGCLAVLLIELAHRRPIDHPTATENFYIECSTHFPSH